MKNKVFIIAEIGVNHNGSFKKALSMVKKLSLIDVDAVKFQKADPASVYSDDSFKAEYQKKNDSSKTVLEMSKNLQLSKIDHVKLQKYCKKKGLLYLCSAFDLNSLKFLDKKLKLPIFKIPSGEINSIDMIDYIAKKNKKILLSTGMSTFEEIKKICKKLDKKKNKKITLLHCVSNYPVNKKNINLNILDEMKKKFNYEIGYSDHSIGEEACLAAVAKGAKVIEKHVTSSVNQKGPDHKASMSLNDFKNMVKKIRNLEVILGSNVKNISKDENDIKKMARKSIVTNVHLKKGHKIKKSDLTFKRPGTGISPIDINKVIGQKVTKDVKANKVLKKIYLKK